jgi:Tetratricopeptide repeat
VDQHWPVHRAIMVVDVERFGDPARTNLNQLAVRGGLYRALAQAFDESGVVWRSCVSEDRGDGALILIPPDVSKTRLVTRLPVCLIRAIKRHNAGSAAPEGMRLRVALHAGEVYGDEHGVAGAAVNHAFRLTEAPALKSALEASPGVIAFIVSDWLFNEVVRHDPEAEPCSYRKVQVAVKETSAVGWIRVLSGLVARDGTQPPTLGLRPGSLRRLWNIPARNPGFTGRDGLLAAVRDRLQAGGTAAVQAFQGMGGVGKTQLAIEYAHRFADQYDLAWWINSEQGGLIGDQVAALGMALGFVQPEAGSDAVRTAVLSELHSRDRWLLVFDNAANPADIAGWLPGGSGHVVITSRERNWADLAAPVDVDVVDRPEAIGILRTRVTALSDSDADRLAGQLGDLPLALAQAAGFMAETGMPAVQYLELLQTQAGQLLSQALPRSSYPQSLSAATRLIAERLDREDLAAAQLASLCAFLGPEPIPEFLFTGSPAELPDDLAVRAASPLAWRQTLAHLVRQSLARIDQRGLVMHRLTQAILRDRLVPSEAVAARQRSERILAASDPADPSNPSTWPRWAQLMPHLLAADLAASDNSSLRWMAFNACWYLLARGDNRTAYDLASDLRQQWRDQLGDDHIHTLVIALHLGWALYATGSLAEARDLNVDIMERMRQTLGEDHPNTLMSANNLASNLRGLGNIEAARDLDQDTLTRRRRVLGDDHIATLFSASNFAADLRELGEVQAAHDLDKDTLARRRRVLGNDHRDTLMSVSNLDADLRLLREDLD